MHSRTARIRPPACGQRLTVRLTPVQAAWVDAIADTRGTSRSAVVRDALTGLAARETVRVQRTRHYRLIGLLARQEHWNPVDEYLHGGAVDRLTAAL